MSVHSKTKIGCSISFTPIDEQFVWFLKMMFEFIRCSMKWCSTHNNIYCRACTSKQCWKCCKKVDHFKFFSNSVDLCNKTRMVGGKPSVYILKKIDGDFLSFLLLKCWSPGPFSWLQAINVGQNGLWIVMYVCNFCLEASFLWFKKRLK